MVYVWAHSFAYKAAPRESWGADDDTHDKAHCSETLRSDTSGTQKHPDCTEGGKDIYYFLCHMLI